MSTYVLAIDIGSSSVRASIFDEQINCLHTEQLKYADSEHDIYTDHHLAFNPTVLTETLFAALDKCLKNKDEQIAAVGISCFQHSLIVIDDESKPLSPLYMWWDDRSCEQAAKLRSNRNETEIHSRTGCRIHTSYWLAKIAWWNQHHRKKNVKYLSYPDYLYSVLFNNFHSSTSMASATGLWNQSENRWDKAILEKMHITKDNLCRVSVEPIKTKLKKEYKQQWEQLKDAVWLPASGDGQCSNLGSSAVLPNHLAVNIGTSAAIRTIVEDCVIELPSQLWNYRINSKQSLVGAAFSDGGNLYKWLLKTLNLPQNDLQLEQLLIHKKTAAHGLTLLPNWSGQRSPDWLLHSRGEISGLQLNHYPIDILQAAMESVACRIGNAALILQKITGTADQIIVSGGAGHSKIWAKMTADAIGQPVLLAEQKELSSRGAAILALDHLGIVKISELKPLKGEIIQPDAENHELYLKMHDRQERLQEKLN